MVCPRCGRTVSASLDRCPACSAALPSATTDLDGVTGLGAPAFDPSGPTIVPGLDTSDQTIAPGFDDDAPTILPGAGGAPPSRSRSSRRASRPRTAATLGEEPAPAD